MFSDREWKVLEVIGNKKINVRDIADRVFKDERAPFDAEISINNTIRRIVEKCEYHDLAWTLTKERGANGRNVIFKKGRK